MLLQVHDEIVLEVAPGEREQVERLVRREMSGAVTLRAPLAVGQRLVDAVAAQQAVRSARKAPGAVRVRVDPQVVD